MENYLIKSYNILPKITAFLKPYIICMKPKKVLSVGCGYKGDIDALIKNRIAPEKIDMIDIQQQALDSIKTDYPGIGNQYCLDLNESLNISDSYKLILAIRIFHHIRCPDILIYELHRLTADKGYLIVEMVCKKVKQDRVVYGLPAQITTNPGGVGWFVDVKTALRHFKARFKKVEVKKSFVDKNAVMPDEERVVFICQKV